MTRLALSSGACPPSTPRGVEVVRQHHPTPDLAVGGAPEKFALHDARLTVARGYGFSGWPALVHYLEIADDLSVDPSRVDDDTLADVDRFCALSVLRYTDTDAPPRWAAAAGMLAVEAGAGGSARLGGRGGRRPGRLGTPPRRPP